MAKLTLAPESLAVESFATLPPAGPGGTVLAHQHGTVNTACGGNSCADTCLQTCGTCFQSCASCGTCPGLGTCPAVSCLGSCITDCGGCGIETAGPYTCRCSTRC